MNALKQSVIIDLDGTLYDSFPHDDRRIISKIFENNKLIKILDKFLWSINSLDFVTNSMRMLNLRLRIYSILSSKNFSDIKKEYMHRYHTLLSVDLQRKEGVLKKLSKMYDIIIVTNNAYANSVLCWYNKFDVIYAPNVTSRREQIIEKSYSQSINYVIGNNYTDDIYLAKKIHALSIYVGKSIIKKIFKADFIVSSFDGVLEILKDGS